MAEKSDFVGVTCKCGSDQFIYPNNPPQDDDVIVCNWCKREIGTVAVIREALLAHGKAEIEKSLSETFGKPVKPDWRREN